MTDTVTSTSPVARLDSGEIQITLTIDADQVKTKSNELVEARAKTAEIAGFRKGKAPLDKVRAAIGEQDLLSEALSYILPKAFASIIEEHKIRPALYPKYEMISQDEKQYVVRAITCEIPEFELGNWKDTVRSEAKSASIWVPGKDEASKPEEDKSSKEQKAVNILLELSSKDGKKIKDVIPHYLIAEETNQRLSQLLEKTEKLGLTLDSYLASIGKNPQQLREEYMAQARNEIVIDVILQRVAQEEKIEITDEEFQKALQAIGQKGPIDSSQASLIRSTLKKRRALEFVAALM